MSHLRSGRCGSGKRRGGSPTGRTAACSSCRCGAPAQPRLHRWPPWHGNGRARPTGRRERGEVGVGPAGAAHERAAWPCLASSGWDPAGSGGGAEALLLGFRRLVLRLGFGALWASLRGPGRDTCFTIKTHFSLCQKKKRHPFSPLKKKPRPPLEHRIKNIETDKYIKGIEYECMRKKKEK